VGDATLAGRLEEIVRTRPSGETESRADAFLMLRAIAVLDPLAPPCWRGIAVWPGGIGPALAAAQRGAEGGVECADVLLDLVASEAVGTWAAVRPGRGDAARLRAEARQWRALLGTRGPAGGARRLVYALNPLLGCESPLLGGRVVARLADLVPALEARGARGDLGVSPVDADIAAFVAARAERPSEAEAASQAAGSGPAAALARLEVVASLQDRCRDPAPALARWLVSNPEQLLLGWRNVAIRARLVERLTALAASGRVRPMLSLLQDPAPRAADLRGALEAGEMLAGVEAELARIEAGIPARDALARNLGQEAAAGIALGALALSLALALFG
jgi:hypothetical protein